MKYIRKLKEGEFSHKAIVSKENAGRLKVELTYDDGSVVLRVIDYDLGGSDHEDYLIKEAK